MMWHVIVYTIVVTAALTLVGHCLEYLAGLRRIARRSAWVAVMLLSVLMPLVMIVSSSAPVTVVGGGSTELSMAVSAASAAEQDPIWKLAVPTDGQVLAMWTGASIGFALYLFGASLLLYLRAARWRWVTVLGQAVLVSEITGPALLGVLLPRIVVPRWLLEQSAVTQRLILEHERQHMRAHDPLLMVAGLLVIIAVPWNPFLWWQWRRMRHAMEIDCDARVLRTGVEARTYAEVLLEVTRRAARIFPGALAMSEPVAALEQRIDHLEPRAHRHTAMQAAAAFGLAMAGVAVGLALDAPALPVRATASTVPVAQGFTATTVTTAPAVTTSAIPADVSSSTSSSATTEASMNKSISIAAAIAAMGASAIAQAQSPQVPAPTPTEGQPVRVTAEQMVQYNDLDGDGIVTREEAVKADKTLNKLWGMYDMDRDGRVDAVEIRRATVDMTVGTALQKITGSSDGHVAKIDPAQVVKANDLDGDGIVTKEEAVKADKALIGLWDNYDINKDGKLDAKEIARASDY